jgi:hypothetical protein
MVLFSTTTPPTWSLMAADVPHVAELVAFERGRLLLPEALACNAVAGDMNPSDGIAIIVAPAGSALVVVVGILFAVISRTSS